MSFLAPMTALIAAGITVPLLVSLYFLKLRRRNLDIPSTLLWKKAIEDMQVNAPFQRLRKNLLLLLQLLLLVALLFAMARPTFQSAAQPGKRVVILIDHSASMNATDMSSTRLDNAKQTAQDIIDALDAPEGGAADSSGGAMVVSFAEQAKVLQPFTTDLPLLRLAVDSIEPTDQRSNLEEVLRLIEPFALEAASQNSDDQGLVVYLLSDGRVQYDQQASLRGAEIRFVQMGASPEDSRKGNVGIVSLSVRRDFEKPHLVQMFAKLSNDGPEPIKTNLTVRLDDQVLRVLHVAIRATAPDASEVSTKSVQITFSQPEAGLLTLKHDYEDDLEMDDHASMVLAPAKRLRVLLVTDGNAFLERVIQAVGVRKLVVMSSKKYEDQDPKFLRRGDWNATGESTGFDCIVFDTYSPKTVPVVDSIYLGAVPPIDGLMLRPFEQRADGKGAPATQVILDWQRDHALLRYVSLDDVVLEKPGRLVVPMTADVLATGQSGPIMAEVSVDGVHHVTTSFNVLASNWPLYISFPVFMSNSMQWLGLGGQLESGIDFRPGQVAVIPTKAERADVGYEGPVALSATAERAQAVLPMFSRVGIYALSKGNDQVVVPWNQLAVNLLNPIESDLRPASQLQIGTTTATGNSQQVLVRREVWYWFAWIALGVLLIEWFVYTKRMHL